MLLSLRNSQNHEGQTEEPKGIILIGAKTPNLTTYLTIFTKFFYLKKTYYDIKFNSAQETTLTKVCVESTLTCFWPLKSTSMCCSQIPPKVRKKGDVSIQGFIRTVSSSTGHVGRHNICGVGSNGPMCQRVSMVDVVLTLSPFLLRCRISNVINCCKQVFFLLFF